MNQAQAFKMFINEERPSFKLGNIFWDSADKIYSYGYHFVLARHINVVDDNGKIQKIFIINNQKYSISTSKQRGILLQTLKQHQATGNYKIIELNFYKITNAYRGMDTYPEDVAALLEKFQPSFWKYEGTFTQSELDQLIDLERVFDERMERSKKQMEKVTE